jgi:mono/diheme cytochrome c family protein
MRAPGFTISSAACLFVLLAGAAAAQQQPAENTRSTRAGVFTAAQAARGRDLYAGLCQGCHTAASHTGVVFRNGWGGRPLWELFDFVLSNMPKSDPGILTREECTQLVAYLLELNEMPAGASELPGDSAALMSIRVDTTAERGIRP